MHVVLTLETITLLQALNGHDVKGEEVTRAQEMFPALHEARVTASKQPLNELVSHVCPHRHHSIWLGVLHRQHVTCFAWIYA